MGRSKLTDRDKEEIRRLSKEEGYTQAMLAAKYNVAKMTIHRTLNPDYYAKTLEQSKEYQRDNAKKIQEQRSKTRRGFILAFNISEDAALINQLDKQDNIHEYIRKLINEDMKKNN